MSIKQLQHTVQIAQPAVLRLWQRKSATEKFIAKVLIGLAALAAGNSGYQLIQVAAFSALTPAQADAIERSLLAGAATGLGALLLAAAGGIGLMLWLDVIVPHGHQDANATHTTATNPRTLWLMIAAISLHNLPEGFAVGATAATTDAQANSTALAVALQNIPEGLIVATGLLALGVSTMAAAGIALLTGMIEPVGAVLGAKIVTALPAATPLAMSFAAGAMLFVVLHEMLPQARKLASPVHTGGLFAGSMLGMWAMNQLGN